MDLSSHYLLERHETTMFFGCSEGVTDLTEMSYINITHTHTQVFSVEFTSQTLIPPNSSQTLISSIKTQPPKSKKPQIPIATTWRPARSTWSWNSKCNACGTSSGNMTRSCRVGPLRWVWGLISTIDPLNMVFSHIQSSPNGKLG